MATSLLLEGEDLEALLLRAAQEGGPGARIVRAEKVRAGGVMGFFARERFEVAVEIPDDDTERPPTTPTRRALRAIPHPRDAADTFEDLREPAAHTYEQTPDRPYEQTPEQPYEQSHLSALVDMLADGVTDDVEIDGLAPAPAGGRPGARPAVRTGVQPAAQPASSVVARAYGTFGPGVSPSIAAQTAVPSAPSAQVHHAPAHPPEVAPDQTAPAATSAAHEAHQGDNVATSSGRHAAPPAGEPAATHAGESASDAVAPVNDRDELVRLINGELSPAELAAEGLLGVVDRVSAAERAASRSVAGQPLAQPQELAFAVPLQRAGLAAAGGRAPQDGSRSIQLPPEVEVGQAAQSAAYAAMYAAAHTRGVVPADARWQAATFPVATPGSPAVHDAPGHRGAPLSQPVDQKDRDGGPAGRPGTDGVLGSVLGVALAETEPPVVMTPSESGQSQNVPTPAHMVTGYTGQGTHNGTVPQETPTSSARPSTARPEFTALLDQLRAGTRPRAAAGDVALESGVPTGTGDLGVTHHAPLPPTAGPAPRVPQAAAAQAPVAAPHAPAQASAAAPVADADPQSEDAQAGGTRTTRPELPLSHISALQQTALQQNAEQLAQDAAAQAARLVHQQLDAERHEAQQYEAWRQDEARRLEDEARRAEARQAQEQWEAQAAQAALMEAERQAHLNAQTQTIEAEAAEAVRAETERMRAERLAAQRAEAERLEAEAAAVVRAEAERIAADQIETHRREAERLAAELAQAERLAAERAEAERLAAERAEAERAEAERLAAELAEAERLAAELAEAERLAAERADRAEAERLEAERVVAEREEAARREVLRAEDERIAALRAEADRAEAEWARTRRVPVPRADTRTSDTRTPDTRTPDVRPADVQHMLAADSGPAQVAPTEAAEVTRPLSRRPTNEIAGAGGLSSIGSASSFSAPGAAPAPGLRGDAYETPAGETGEDWFDTSARTAEGQVAADRAMLRDLGMPASWTRRLRTGDRFSAVLKMLEPMPVVDIDPDVAVVAVVGPAHLVHLEAYRTAADLPVGGRPRPVVVVPATVGPARAAELARSQRHAAVVVAIETPWYDGIEMVLESLQTIRAGAVIAIVDAERPLLETQGWLDALGSVDALTVDGATTVPQPAAVLQLGLPVVRLDGIPIDHLTWTALLCAQLEAAKPAEPRN